MRKPVQALFPLVLVVLFAPSMFAFTQQGAYYGHLGSGSPMGHEWLTRRAAIELLLGNDPIMPPDPTDPRKTWTQGLAQNLSLAGAENEVLRIQSIPNTESRYASTYEFVFDAIIGERWVDLGGMNVAAMLKDKQYDCFDNMTQNPASVQYDHFMRRYDDADGAGGVNAGQQSQQRFVNYFVTAAMAPPMTVEVIDGGLSTSSYSVDLNYFLMGRAAHLFQDSFSLEHTVRVPDDNYTSIKQVKSYLCATGSEQHDHSFLDVVNASSGDVIWVQGIIGTGWQYYEPHYMKTNALVALEAMKDLWAAFIRTMAVPYGTARQAKAQSEAQTLVANWLKMDNNMATYYSDTTKRGSTYVLGTGDSAPGQTQTACMTATFPTSKGSQQTYVNYINKQQQACMFNVMPNPGYADLWDTQLNLPFYWKWRSSTNWMIAPSGWTPSPTALPTMTTGQRFWLSTATKVTLGVDGTLVSGADVVADNAAIPLQLTAVGDMTSPSGAYLRARFAPTLFLSYTAVSGAMELAGPLNAQFVVTGNPTTVMNTFFKQYMWYDTNGLVHLSSAGNPSNANSMWIVTNNQ